jgi:dinuclear metal center YbgI/SA1388 family protein
MEIGTIIQELEAVAPPEMAEEFDNGRIGLVIEGKSELSTIACALDATPAVVESAVAAGVDMLVVHHTPLWHPVTTVSSSLGSLLRPILGSGMNVYVLHTNYDHAPGGINDTLAGLLGLTDIERMSPGLIGTCNLTFQEISKALNVPLRVWGNARFPQRLAVVGGSGFDVEIIVEAVSRGADTFLSSELKHSVLRSMPGVTFIEATHYALEAPGMKKLAFEKNWLYIDDTPRMCIWM